MNPVWSARTGGGADPVLARFGDSTLDDAPFVEHDVAGSIAHVAALHAAGLLGDADAERLVAGLQDLHHAWLEGSWRLDPALEDVHMNIEARLTETLGDAGRRLHTGRSRNDQVATCLVLHARAGLAALAAQLHGLSEALATQAADEAETPWTACTHGQPAQPATLGFLLLAHAWRTQDAVRHVLHAFDEAGECPLGSGAVAGSTLPLRPDVAARLLGLRPPRNALLATGTRDATLAACRAARRAGDVLAGLAQDLLTLHDQGALRLADGLATGSSLMPHKRNPDALELARGAAKALAGAVASVEAVASGLGLGYVRDLQLVKPPQHQALSSAAATTGLLCRVVATARFDADTLRAGLDAPGITATDMAEALVLHGVAFRDAYAAVARAHAQPDPVASLRAEALPAQALEAALAAAAPEPSRRACIGGPAPETVRDAISQWRHEHDALSQRITIANEAVVQPQRLLASGVPQTLVDA